MEDKPKKKKGNPNWSKGMPPANPHGRPPGTSNLKTKIQEQFLAMMEQKVDVAGSKKVFLDAYNEAFLKDALVPGSVAYKFLAERLFGMSILSDIETSVNKSKREDLDFAQYRVLKRAFDIQQKVILSQSKDIGVMAGRRAGKSETNKLKAISQCVMPMQRVLVIGLTIMKTHQIYWDDIIRILSELGYGFQASSTDSIIRFDNGSILVFGGNSSKVEREKYRGQHWDLIIIDEAQSQPELGMFVKEIINPMLLDTNGTLMLTGSGPRTRGTYWEQYFNNPSPSGLRVNWNLSMNPFIHNYQEALANEREKHGLTETDPLYMREYLGLIVYDDDALVYRFNDENYYTDEELFAWIGSQSPEDIRFVAGLDYGFRDSDALVVTMYSEKRNEKFLVYEYKKNGTDITQLTEAIKEAKEYVRNKFSMCYYKEFDIYADTNEQKISTELTNRYNIPVHAAIKYDKAMAIQMLQEEVRKRNLKVRRGSEFDQESLRIIFKRIEQEGQPSIITKEIDDDVFHPDIMDAVLYSLRLYWLTHQPDHYEAPKTTVTPLQQISNFQMPSNLKNPGSQLF